MKKKQKKCFYSEIQLIDWINKVVLICKQSKLSAVKLIKDSSGQVHITYIDKKLISGISVPIDDKKLFEDLFYFSTHLASQISKLPIEISCYENKPWNYQRILLSLSGLKPNSKGHIKKKILISPKKIFGNWTLGYALDEHTIHSKRINSSGEDQLHFETKRTYIGELLYRLKYRKDKKVLQEIVQLLMECSSFQTINMIITVPGSSPRNSPHPIVLVARAFSQARHLPLLEGVVKKNRKTPELKNIKDPKKRKEILHNAFTVKPPGILSGQTILLLDDVYRSGSTLESVTSVLFSQGKAKKVNVLTLTKTRSKK